MKNKILIIILLLPVILIFIVFGMTNITNLPLDIVADKIDLSYDAVEELVLDNEKGKFKLEAKVLPVLAQDKALRWDIDIIDKFGLDEEDSSFAKLVANEEEVYIEAYLKCKIKVSATLLNNNFTKEFNLLVLTDGVNPSSIEYLPKNLGNSQLDNKYYYGMKKYVNDQEEKDYIDLNVKIFPKSANQAINYEYNEEEVIIADNKMCFLKDGLIKIKAISAENASIYTELEFNVVNGINIYSYHDLMLATNLSYDGEIVVMQTNLLSMQDILEYLDLPFNYQPTEEQLNMATSCGRSLYGNYDKGEIKFSLDEIASTYDTDFYKNKSQIPPKLKVGVNFKRNVYGNGFTINSHELSFPTAIQAGTNKPILSQNDLFRGPLEFISAGGLTVYGQDNINFLISNDNTLLNDLHLMSCNTVTDLTHLDYVGTTLEIMGDNVTIDNAIIENGRTVLRSFSNENLVIKGSLLRYAREFIFKLGSNSIIRSIEDSNGKLITLSPELEVIDGIPRSDSSCVIENSFFYKSGIFSIGLDTHFCGSLLYDGTKYIEAAHHLAATSFASILTIKNDVRFYDWKDINDLDSSTLLSGYNENLQFNIAKLIKLAADGTKIIKTAEINGKITELVHGGIAYFGGGRNYSIVKYLDNYNYENLLIDESFTVDDDRLGNVNPILALSAGVEPFRFRLYPNDFSKFDFNEKPNIKDLLKY